MIFCLLLLACVFKFAMEALLCKSLTSHCALSCDIFPPLTLMGKDFTFLPLSVLLSNIRPWVKSTHCHYFLILISILSISYIAHSTMLALHQMTPTVHVLIPLIFLNITLIWLVFSIFHNIFLTAFPSFFSLTRSSCSISKNFYNQMCQSFSLLLHLAFLISLNASSFLTALPTPYTWLCQTSYQCLGRKCATVFIKEFSSLSFFLYCFTSSTNNTMQYTPFHAVKQ